MLHELKNKGIFITLCWIPFHIGIQENEDADKTAKKAIGSLLDVSTEGLLKVGLKGTECPFIRGRPLIGEELLLALVVEWSLHLVS